MDRRIFLNRLFWGSAGFALPVFLEGCGPRSQRIRFAVCTDVHQDIIHDGPERINTFIQAAEKANAGFVIQLGDFCFPLEENKAFMEKWNSFNGPKYHVLGNHDMDVSSKAVTQKFWNMENPYYSFDQGGFHFVVLDPNYFLHEGEFVDYENGNYYAHAGSRAFLPKPQVEWLKKDLEATDKFTIVFSHQSLISPGSIKNQEAIRELFEKVNLDQKRVIACFSGHEHRDYHLERNGIHYIGVNSASYKWVGNEFQYAGRFDAETNKRRPSLKNTIPYADPLFAIIDIDSRGVLTIKGKESTFIPPGPKELGVETGGDNKQVVPLISDRVLHFDT